MIARCARMCRGDKCPPHCPRPPHCCRRQQFHRLLPISPGVSRISLCPTGRISCSEPRRRARRYRVAGRWSCVSSATPGNPPKNYQNPVQTGWYNALFQYVASLYATPPGFLSSHLFPGVALALLPLRLAPPPAIIYRPRTRAHGFVSRKRLSSC